MMSTNGLTGVVGRDAELASIRDFVARVSDAASALVLEGEAGMGKTTLWRAAVEHAEDAGLLVVQAQPVESEMTLSFAGVGDLLDPIRTEPSNGCPLCSGTRWSALSCSARTKARRSIRVLSGSR